MWERVRGDEEASQFFNTLGVDTLNDDLFAELYGDRKRTSVNGLSSKLFWKHWRKIIDISILP